MSTETQSLYWKKKKITLEKGTRVQVNWRPVFSTEEGPCWKTATVVDVLSAQFTCFVDVDGSPLSYQLYTNIGDSWRPFYD